MERLCNAALANSNVAYTRQVKGNAPAKDQGSKACDYCLFNSSRHQQQLQVNK